MGDFGIQTVCVYGGPVFCISERVSVDLGVGGELPLAGPVAIRVA